MLIISASADGSSSGLGRITRTIDGIPATDLVGYWPCDTGDIGDGIESLTDRSGNGRHATLVDGWLPCHKTAEGVVIDNVDGSMLATGLPINPAGRRQTVFIAGSTLLPGEEVGVYNTWIGSSINDAGAAPGDAKLNAPALAMTSNGTTTNGGTIIFDNGSDLLGVGSIAAAFPPLGVDGIFAMDIDATTNTVKLHVYGQSTVSVTNAAIGAYYDGVTDLGHLTIGAWAHGAPRTAGASLANLYSVVAFDRTFSETAAQKYMQYIADMLADRGLIFA